MKRSCIFRQLSSTLVVLFVIFITNNYLFAALPKEAETTRGNCDEGDPVDTYWFTFTDTDGDGEWDWISGRKCDGTLENRALNEDGTSFGTISGNSSVMSGSVTANSNFTIRLNDNNGNPLAHLIYNSVTQTYTLFWLPAAPQQQPIENNLPPINQNLDEKDKLQIAHFINEYKGSPKKFKVYPNPSTKSVSLDLNNYIGKNIEILISNIEGKEIIRKEYENLSENLILLNFDTYPKGIYFISVFSGTNSVTQKIIIE